MEIGQVISCAWLLSLLGCSDHILSVFREFGGGRHAAQLFLPARIRSEKYKIYNTHTQNHTFNKNVARKEKSASGNSEEWL